MPKEIGKIPANDLIRLSALAFVFGLTGQANPGLAAQSGTIALTGAVSQNCTVVVTANAAASSLELTGGATRAEIGTILQSCNKKVGYALTVASTNCSTGTAGAKLLGAAGGEALRYTVEFNNPTTGGSSPIVANLLSNACVGTAVITGREVTNAKITDETSQVFVNYTGDAGLGADSYTDTLTLTMSVK